MLVAHFSPIMRELVLSYGSHFYGMIHPHVTPDVYQHHLSPFAGLCWVPTNSPHGASFPGWTQQ